MWVEYIHLIQIIEYIINIMIYPNDTGFFNCNLTNLFCDKCNPERNFEKCEKWILIIILIKYVFYVKLMDILMIFNVLNITLLLYTFIFQKSSFILKLLV